MTTKRIRWYFVGIIALAVISFCFVYPSPYNQAVDYLNSKLGFNFPHFFDKPFRLGLDLKGGTHLLYEADLSKISTTDKSTAMQGLRDIIERRVNLFGVQEPLVQTQQSANSFRLIVELADVKDPAEAIKMIGQTPFLEFKEQKPEAETQKILDVKKQFEGKSMEEIQKIKDWQIGLQDPYFTSTTLTGRYLKKAELTFDPNTQEPMVSLQFDDEGAKLFEDLTGKNVGKPLAIYIDNVAISSPVVNAKISGGKAQITGKFSVQEARELVRNLNAGALPVPIKLISQQNIGPTLGADSLNKSLIAGLFGLLAVVVFMILFYRLPGLLASLALCVYIVITLAVFKLIPVTMTLAGIGGFLLSIGMAVDANVLIFSRFREEQEDGKSFSASLEDGFKRSWPAIRDGNATTILVAVILFFFGTTFFQGFALTLIIGILISMFSAIIITRTFMRMFIGTRFENIKWLWR